jgi:hypothetical protein
MIINWKTKNFKPEIVLNKVNASVQVVDGRISFAGFSFYDDLIALKTMLTFPKSMTDQDKDRLIRKAISVVAKDQPVNKINFLAALNDVLIEANRTEVRQFHVLTSISISRNFKRRTFNVGTCKIVFVGEKWPRKFVDRDELIASSRVLPRGDVHKLEKLQISVRAKSANQTMTVALRALDLQRAIWCYLGNFDMQISGNTWKPINRIRLGQHHTVHAATGEPAGNIIWYEPNFDEMDLFTAEDPALFIRNSNWIKRRIEQSTSSMILEDVLIRYVRALDEPDQNTALMRLWAALEALAAPRGQNAADAIVRRCSFLFADWEYWKQILEHLREYRNTHVHAGEQSDNALFHCYQLQNFFRTLFSFHLGTGASFQDIHEANEFLDQPCDIDILLARKKLITRALAFRVPRAGTIGLT